jgi:hypothetical protein
MYAGQALLLLHLVESRSIMRNINHSRKIGDLQHLRGYAPLGAWG